MKPTRKAIATVVEATCSADPARQATVFLSPDCIVRATRQCRPGRRSCRTTVILTLGKPNYEERAFIKLCQKAGEPLPVRKVQLKWYPKKK